MDGKQLQGRVTGVAAGSFVLGLALWYFGGSTAILGLLDGLTPIAGVLVVCLLVAAVTTVLLVRADLRFRTAAGDALFMGAGLALLFASVVPLVNRWFDDSAARPIAFTVTATHQGSKGPSTIDVEFDGRRENFPREQECERGSTGTAALHDGLLRLEWVSDIRCQPPPPKQ